METLEEPLDLTSNPKGARSNTRNAPRIWGFGGALVLSVFAAACTAQSVGVDADDRSATDFLGSIGPSAGGSAIFESGDNPDREYVNNVLDALAASQDRPGELAQAQAIHWNPARTAKNNGGGAQGEALELTWSIIPDGTFVANSVGEPDCTSTLVASLNAAYGAGNWQAEMEKVWDDWTRLTGNIYTPAVPLDANGTPIETAPAKAWGPFPSSPGQDGVQGDIRIGGCSIDGAQGTNILAYNFFPNNGDMKIDTDNLRFLNLTTEFHNIFSHEHGHGAGLSHVCPTNQTKLMEPFLSRAFIGLQHDDIRVVQRLYGDRFEKINAPNDNAGAATRINPYALPRGQTELQLSMDSTSDEDWFQFSGRAGDALDVSVAPNGLSYAQGQSCKTINSRSVQDLSFEIRQAGEVLSVVNATSAGNSESATGFILPTTGTYYVRVLGTGTDDSQLYDMTVTVVAATPPTVTPISPARLYESRSGPNDNTIDGKQQGLGRTPAGQTAIINVAGRADIPTNATAVFFNVVAATPSGPGFLTVFPCGTKQPLAANVNYNGNDIGSNAVLAKIGTNGNVCVYTSAATDLIIDVNGYVPASGSPNPISPARLYESRSGPNDNTIDGKQQGLGRTPAGQTAIINVAGRADIPTNATAVFFNVVAATPSGPGFLTVFPCGTKQPLAANVNYNGNDIGSNAVLAKIGTNGNVCVYTSAATDLIIDVNGYVPASK